MTWFVVMLSVLACTGCGVAVDSPESSDDSQQEGEKDTPSSDPSSPSSDPECSKPSWAGDLEVGTGEECFASVSDGDVLPLIGGRQGGFHLWLGVRCRDCGGDEIVTFGVRDPATGESLWGEGQSEYVDLDEADGYSQGAGLTALVPGDSWSSEPGTGADFVGQNLDLYAEIELGDVVYTSSVNITVGAVEYVPNDCPQCN
jgi:hypothetical protein